MIPNPKLNIWEHSSKTRDLCRRRAMDLEPEMDCAAQGAQLAAPFLQGPDCRLLDVGCAGAHFRHSLRRVGVKCEYYGIDSSPSMVYLAKHAMRERGEDAERIIPVDVSNLE